MAMTISPDNLESFTTGEMLLIHKLGASEGWTAITLDRRSAREFDLSVAGSRGQDRFSAWLPLAAIHALPSWEQAWTMCDIPEMRGDWSAIRDSEVETIWTIFFTLCFAPSPKRSRVRGTSR